MKLYIVVINIAIYIIITINTFYKGKSTIEIVIFDNTLENKSYLKSEFSKANLNHSIKHIKA